MILALDQSLSQSGVALCDDDGNILYTGVINTKSSMEWFLRLSHIYNSIIEIIEKNWDASPLHIVMENLAFGGSYRLADLAALAGVLRYKLQEKYGVHVHSLIAAHHKQYITHSGRADKDLVIKKLESRFGIVEPNNNIADSLSLMLTYFNMLQFESGKGDHSQYDRILFKRIRANLSGIRITKRKKRSRRAHKSTELTESCREETPFDLS